MSGIFHHHERHDGKGYNATSADKQTLFSKIIGIADAFDAMTSTRPYRDGMPKDVALKRIEDCLDSQFDGEVGRAFILMANEGKLDFVIGSFDFEKKMLVCNMCGPIIVYDNADTQKGCVTCPACKTLYSLHKDKDSFVLESTNTFNHAHRSKIDEGIINDFVKTVSSKTNRGFWIFGK